MTTRIITDSNGRKHITNEPLLHPPLTVQEPVGYVYWSKGHAEGAIDVQTLKPGTPLYTSPAAQPVQELVASPYNPNPVEYQYHYPDGLWRCSNGDAINGMRPDRARSLYALKDNT